MRTLAIFTVFTVALCGAVLASIPDLNNSFATMDAEANGASVLIVPDGSGARFDEARAPGGVVVDATITLTLLDAVGVPIAFYPLEDIWLETTAGGLVSCAGGSSPDAHTDQNGQTIWLQPLLAGGCSGGESTEVVVSGESLFSSPLDLFFVSPDLSGDGEIDLADIVMFTQALAEYEPCVDFNHDGDVDLADIVIMVPAIGAACQ